MSNPISPADSPPTAADSPATATPDTPARPIAEDVGNGLRFNHHMQMQTKAQLSELSASFYALLEVAVARGVIPVEEYEKRRQVTSQRESERIRSDALVILHDVPDKYALADLPQIDCDARIPLCRARCCTLVFPLSTQDLDERIVRWNYGRPYQIAQAADGYCAHNSPTTRGCTVYHHRPAVCRTYDCRTDQRIWLDFNNRIPAP